MGRKKFSVPVDHRLRSGQLRDERLPSDRSYSYQTFAYTDTLKSVKADPQKSGWFIGDDTTLIDVDNDGRERKNASCTRTHHRNEEPKVISAP